ncbi:SH2 domain protein [Dictyocaulus viviparus]|uniref:Tyrosine-protein kinase n=1 Tax=Dictyocaulus viviparus TaxID=29172 RepID=A0A0D8XQE4_DICVI|nr:SH2 domain protein [Dictyocaulus viviparus]
MEVATNVQENDGKLDDAEDAEKDLELLQVKARIQLPLDNVNEKMLANLEKHEWYHGCLPYEDIAGLLKDNGDFLVREVGPEGDRTAMACVTVKWNETVQNFPVHSLCKGNERQYTIDGNNKSDDVMKLIQNHLNKIPIGDNILLKRPIPKQRWELTSNKVKLQKKIGAGKFGEVWKGTMIEEANKPPIDVAIKVGKISNENKAMIDEMYKEARLMRQYKHRNVVAFYGVVIDNSGNVMIVMEMIYGGGLNDHLKKQKVEVKDKTSYSIDVAIGLLYLHSKGCMHRDIACRNCLIDVRANIVKISDFGLSKQADSYNIPQDEPLPIRWQAPEVIATRVYTMKSDVYSFGILLWEIFNDAEVPFKGIDNKTIKSKIGDPKFRPPLDPSIPLIIRRVMKTCWRAEPTRRPTMELLAKYLIHSPADSAPNTEHTEGVLRKAKNSIINSMRSKKRTRSNDRYRLLSLMKERRNQ